ncbi:MAG: HAD family phosphatase [Cytophagia bacterium]|nr:HAD family phosphatase [Cytophagia bacterium]NBW37802.1 HAD family phosphatase [Cytophagia bacterium]
MKEISIRALLFDMDGVVIDSNTEIEQFWMDWAKKENLVLERKDLIDYVHGRTTQETIHKLFYNASPELKEEIAKEARAFDLAMRPKLIKGLDGFLNSLLANFNKVGLVTSAPQQRVKAMLDFNGVYNSFSCIVTSDDFKKSKPDPEPYLIGAKRFNISPSDCLVFEDSNSGISSAIAAGAYVVAIDNYSFKNDKVIACIKDYENLRIHENHVVNITEGLKIRLVS